MKIRGLHTEDTAFLVDSWAKAARARIAPVERELVTHERAVAQIARVLGRDGIVVRVGTIETQGAGSNPNTERIIGWVVADLPAYVLHYAYVRHEYRGHGYARMLVGAAFGPEAHDLRLSLHAAPPPKLAQKLRRRGWTVASHVFYAESVRDV